MKNLDIAFPNKSLRWKRKIALKTYKFFFFQSILTTYYFIHWDKLRDIIIFKDENALKEIIKNKQVFYYSAHFGLWELMSLYMIKYVKNAIGIYQKIHNRALNRFLLNFRTKNGGIYIDRRNTKKILKYIKNGWDFASIIDQRPIEKGYEVAFLGVPTRFYISTFKLAVKFNVRVIFMFSYYENGKIYIEYEHIKVNNPEEYVARYANTLEKYIRKYPEQYFWFHNRWKNVR